MKKLTIGIPTFNSCGYLEEALKNIIEQVGVCDDIEVLICDNASIDDTDLMIDGYIKRFPGLIRYIKQDSNLGMDMNFWSVVENADGEFVHLHGDDDFYTRDGLKRILEKIHHGDYDVILLSNNYLNTCNGKTIQNNELYENDVVCLSGEEFFLHENLKSLCLSNIILRRSKCPELCDIEKYFGCQWLHIALLMHTVKCSSSTFIFNFKDPVVTVRIGNQKWLQKDGAIAYYYNALLLFFELSKFGYNRGVFEHIKKIFLPLILNGNRINFRKVHLNIYYCIRFFKFYNNMPLSYILFCAKLTLRRPRPFFEGWESIGSS